MLSASSGLGGDGELQTCHRAVGATQAITFVVTVTAPGSVPVSNTATASAATFDPNIANNTVTLLTKVGP